MLFHKSEAFNKEREFVEWFKTLITNPDVEWVGVYCVKRANNEFFAYYALRNEDSSEKCCLDRECTNGSTVRRKDTLSLVEMNLLFRNKIPKMCTVYTNNTDIDGFGWKNAHINYISATTNSFRTYIYPFDKNNSPIWVATTKDNVIFAFLPFEGKLESADIETTTPEMFSTLSLKTDTPVQTVYGVVPSEVAFRQNSVYYKYRVGLHTSIPKEVNRFKAMNATWIGYKRALSIASSYIPDNLIIRFDRSINIDGFKNVGMMMKEPPNNDVIELIYGTPEKELITYRDCKFKQPTDMICDENGFNLDGFNLVTNSPFDEDGFDINGIHKNTGVEYNERGFNCRGIHKTTRHVYDEHGYDFNGFDERGFDKNSIHETTLCLYDEQGYDVDGFNEKGTNRNGQKRGDFFDEEGINTITKTEFNENGVDANGFDYRGFDKSAKRHLNGTPYDESGYDIHNDNGKGTYRFARKLDNSDEAASQMDNE